MENGGDFMNQCLVFVHRLSCFLIGWGGSSPSRVEVSQILINCSKIEPNASSTLRVPNVSTIHSSVGHFWPATLSTGPEGAGPELMHGSANGIAAV